MLIVTDGAVDLPDDLADSPLLRRVPGEVWAGEAPFSGDLDQFWNGLRRGVYPVTTPPTVNALAAAYDHPDLVIGIHVSSHLSATYQRAKEAAVRVGGVVVIDTGSLSVGAGLAVAALCRRALEQGATADPIIDLAKSLPARLHTFALIQDVESLRRSDRSGLLPRSHLARNHPLVLAVRGRVVALAQPKHRTAAVRELARHLRQSEGSRLGVWALAHGDAADIDAVVDQLTQTLGSAPRYVTRLDPTVGAHLGPDSIVTGALTGPIEV